MSEALRLPARETALAPFPVGWYAVAYAREVKQLITRQFMGRDIVLYRTASGVLVAADATCPHMGAHLGHGGRVEGESLRCPFHGFCFDPNGVCVSTPYGGKVPRIGLRTYPVQEHQGIVLCYYDPFERAPTWNIEVPSNEGWSAPAYRAWTIQGHPQEIHENSVDFGHFSALHGFADVAATQPLHIERHLLRVSYQATRVWKVGRLTFFATTQQHGLGFSHVEVRIPKLAVSLRQYFMPTPAYENVTVLRSVTRVRVGKHSGIFAYAIAQLIARTLGGEVKPDFTIWRHKKYLPNPGLAQGDGPIMRYRTWAAQFGGGR